MNILLRFINSHYSVVLVLMIVPVTVLAMVSGTARGQFAYFVHEGRTL